LPLALKLKKKGKVVIFDFHENVSQQVLYKNWIPQIIRKLVAISYRIYETKESSKFDALITVTPSFVERLRKINPSTFLITNYPILKKHEIRDKLLISKSICFAGGISTQWNHLNIIKAIENIEDVNYILAGSGTDNYINLLKGTKGWGKVNYLGGIPYEKVKNIYSQSFAGMALLSRETQVGNEGTLGNTKIFEYMEAGLPIICSNNKLWKEIIHSYQCEIAVECNSVEEIINAILTLQNNPDLALEMGVNGRRTVEKVFNWETQECELSKIYSLLTKKLIEY